MSKKILNLESLIYNHKSRNRAKLHIFEHILEQCHSQVTRYNSEFKLDCCYFSIPLIVTGLPADDMPHLINFLVFRLTENGLLCHYIEKSNQIYISWKEEDIDLAKYFNVKKSIENNISIVQHENISDLKSGRYAEDVLINGKKAKSAKYIQYEREKQFQKDIQGRNVQPSSFEDFVRKMGGSVG